MIPPSNCPYKGLTAPPCYNCQYYIIDLDGCKLNPYIPQSNAIVAPSYEERLRQYEEDRKKLLELSKEALVDLILHRPTMF